MIEILYSDHQVAVCIKPAGIVSQDAGDGSMPGLLRAQLGVESVFAVHRLDRDVGGVMVYALTKKSAAALSKAVQERKLEKEYRALLQGAPAQPEAVLQDLLFHDKTRNKTYIVDRKRNGVKDASLEYTTCCSKADHTLVHVKLHTGRTHQIRVQFAGRGTPLVGDRKYGGKGTGLPLCLWSSLLSFPHPVSGKPMTFTAEAPWEQEWQTWFT